MDNNITRAEKRERRQYLYLIKYRDKKIPKLYPYILIAMIVLVHLLDTYSTDVIIKIQSLYVNEFFVINKGMEFEAGLQQATLISTIGYVLILIGPFYKALMDKVGRRPIFVINVLGMSLGMLLCYISTNFYIFAAGQILITFFIMHDMQMLYVYEVAPAKWRSAMYFSCKFIGVFGTLAIPLIRDSFVSEDGSGWRNVFIIPVLAGLAIFVLSALFMRESGVFVKNRLEYLMKDRETRRKELEINKRKSGIFPAFKYIFKQRQLKWLAITLMTTCTSLYAITMYYESFMSTMLTVSDVTKVLYYQPFAIGLAYLISGISADTIGRKKTIAIFSTITLAAFIAFIISLLKGLNPSVIGILLGLYIGSFWNVTDLNGMMFAESTPTELRGSVMGAQALLMAMGTAVSLLLCIILLSFAKLHIIMIVVGIPGLTIGAYFAMTKLKETKGTRLQDVKYEA